MRRMIMMAAALAAMVALSGCAASDSKIRVGTDAHVFTLAERISLGGTTIVAEDGSTINLGGGSDKDLGINDIYGGNGK